MNFFLLHPSKITEEKNSPSFSLRTPPVFLFLSPPFLAHGRRASCSSATSFLSKSAECSSGVFSCRYGFVGATMIILACSRGA